MDDLVSTFRILTAAYEAKVDRAMLPLRPAEFERLMRERYEPVLTTDEYARVRQACGLGAVIDGETVAQRRQIGRG